MSASSERRPGRPHGHDPETLELIRRVKDHAREGLSVAEIAAHEGISPSYVKLLKKAPLDGTARPRKPPALRLNERALAHHAVLAMRRDTRLRGFDPGKKLFWLDCVMEIHALGDDDGLAFGADGDPFETHPEFATALGGKPDDLEHFLRRGLLTRRPDGGIDLPVKIGLKPKEAPRVMLPGSGEQPLAQRFESADESENEDSENPPISLSERTEKSPQFHYPEDREPPPISLSPAELARPAAAAANAKEDQSLNSSSSNGSRADTGDSEIRQFLCPSDSEIPDSDIKSQRPALLALTDRLMAAAKIDHPANADDLCVAREWMAAGFAADDMCAVVEAKMVQRKGVPPTALRYFDKPIRTALGPKATAAVITLPPQSTPAAPQPALSAADQVLKDELHALWQRAHTARKSRLPPVFAAYQAAASNGHEPDARRWLAVYKGCLAADSLGGLPEFGSYLTSPADYEATLLEIEEALTAPDPEAAD